MNDYRPVFRILQDELLMQTVINLDKLNALVNEKLEEKAKEFGKAQPNPVQDSCCEDFGDVHES